MATVRHLGLFPWCPFPDRQTIIDEYWFGDPNPVTTQLNNYEGLSTSFADSMALYWRVKSWRIFGSFTTNAGAGISTISYDGTTTRSAFTSEKDLVCAVVEGVGEDAFYYVPPFDSIDFTGSVLGIGYTPQFTADFQLQWLPFAGLPLSYKRGFSHLNGNGGIFNWVAFSYNTGDSGDFQYGTVFVREPAEVNPSSFAPTTIPISFLGKTYSINAVTVPENGSAEVTIEASEYWPYDPGDGLGPIYNSATGAQLRPFPA
jgi:hypothetical protein